MKLTIDCAVLADAVKATGVAINSRSSIPALGGVHLQAGDALTLTAFDLDTLAVVNIEPDACEPGSALVSHRLLSQVCAVAPAGTVTLTVEGNILIVSAKRSVWRLPLMNADDYPRLPDLGEEVCSLPSADLFADAVTRVELAADGSTLSDLAVIRIREADKQLTLAATDRYRIHTAALDPDSITADWTVHVTARKLRDMLNTLPDEPIRLLRSDGMFAVATNTATLATRILDAQFPNVEQLMQTVRDPHILRFDRADFGDAVQQASGLDSDRRAFLTMTIRNGEAVMEVRDKISEGQGSATVACGYDGQPFSTGFNVRYLTDMIKIGHGPTIELHMTQPLKPFGVADGGETPDRMLMPVRHPGAGWLQP